MARPLFNSTGKPVALGKEIGSGGEGSVFDLPNANGLVAKLYKGLPNTQKQEKLRLMPRISDAQVLKYSAWPQDTLHSAAGGPVVGFVMGKMPPMTEIHMIYSPAHRKREFPKMAWDFLVFSARNVAAAFTVLHERKHVLGDVNHGNAFVSSKSTVILIDTDSYQIEAEGKTYLCEVGVSHFTPPELQGISSFTTGKRTQNHDNFGLALLIFHLLFGGRHPFAGVPQRKEMDNTLEDNIKHLRFAYSRTNKARHLLEPPQSIPLDAVPPDIAAMFEAAFTELGVAGRRPTARQWMEALDRLRGALRKCPVSSMHVYSTHLAECPWCALEKQGVIYFAATGFTRSTGAGAPIDIAQIWTAILNIRPPNAPETPVPVPIKVQPTALPSGYVSSMSRFMVAVFVVVAWVALANIAPKQAGLWVLGGLVGLVYAYNMGRSSSLKIAADRKAVLQRTKADLAHAFATYKSAVGPVAFAAKRSALELLKREFEGLAVKEQKDLEALRLTAEKRQLELFLTGFYIDQAGLSGIGPAKRAALRSFGIETAADIQAARVRRVKGFGDVLTATLMKWRNALVARFRYDPSKAVTNDDRAAVKRGIQLRAQQIKRGLSDGLAELQQFSVLQQQAARIHGQTIQVIAQRLAQAEADCSIL